MNNYLKIIKNKKYLSFIRTFMEFDYSKTVCLYEVIHIDQSICQHVDVLTVKCKL